MNIPWIQLSHKLSCDNFTAAEAIEEGKLLWEVALRPAKFTDFMGETHTAAGHFFIVRLDDYSVLGAAKTRYMPLQNREAFVFMDNLVQEGLVNFKYAGSSNGGQYIYLLANLPTHISINNNIYRNFLLLSNSHNGSSKVKITHLIISPEDICLPTSAESSFSIMHTKNLHFSVEKARKSLQIINESLPTIEKNYQRLSTTQITPYQFEGIIRNVFPQQEGKKVNTVRKLVEQYKIIHKNGQKTALDALQFLSTYLDTTRGRTINARLSYSWFGPGQDLKVRLLEKFLGI